ncbi:MAG: FtsB family cell division protein [bacterium]
MSSHSARLRTARRIPHRRPAAPPRPAPYDAGRRRRPLRKTRTGVPRWIWNLGVAALLIVCAIAFTTTFLELFRLQREADRLLRMRQSLQQETATLREEIRALHTLEYIEKIAREQLGLVKPGEIALLIVQPPAPAPPQAPRSEQPSWLFRVVRSLTRWLAR